MLLGVHVPNYKQNFPASQALPLLLPIHQSQLVTYLKLSNLRLGLLINFNNFNVVLFKQGVQRVIR